MGSFKLLAALFSRERYEALVDLYGARYMAFATAVLALFALAAAFMAAYSANELRIIERLQSSGKLTEGQVVELDVKKQLRKSDHQVWVTYRFQDPEGQTHNANDYRHENGPSGLVQAQRIAVVYDPVEPRTSRLADGLSARLNDLRLVLQSCLFAALLFGAFVMRHLQWRRVGARSLAGS